MEDLDLDDLADLDELDGACPKKGRKKMGVHYSSETDKWNTPKWVIERVVSVLRCIDLDPCAASNPEHVPAKMHYTEEMDGLKQPWIANTLFMNPPYGDVIKQWIAKLVAEYNAGNVKEAIALVGARPDTEWWSYSNNRPVIFLRGRLHFNESKDSAPFPSALIYYGPYWWTFAKVFKDVGHLYLPHSFAEKEIP